MKMNKKVLNILVTGANGYIGMRLIPKLVENGHRVYCVVRNPERLSLNPDLLKKVKIIPITSRATIRTAATILLISKESIFLNFVVNV